MTSLTAAQLTRPVLDWTAATATCAECGARQWGHTWALEQWLATHAVDCPRSLREVRR